MSSAGASRDGKPASSDAAQPSGTGPADDAAAHERAQTTATAVVSPAESPAESPAPPGEARQSEAQQSEAQQSEASAPAPAQDPVPPKAPGRTGNRTSNKRAGQRSGKLAAAFRFLTRPPFTWIAMPFIWVGRFFAWLWRHNWFRHVVLVLAYTAAGIGATWPRFTYLAAGKLPRTTDVTAFVWGFWWVAHQVVHLGNPFFTTHMAAPAGIQLGFSTLMPLAGYVMTPVTLLFGPSAAFTVLSLIAPGLLCYVMYRAARLWLNQPGSIAAGAFFGLSSMMMWQNWYHLNIALGLIFLPLTIEAAVRLRRSQKIGPAIWLGIALGGAVMTSQEGAAIALLLAAALLVPWVIGKLFRDRQSLRKVLIPLGIGAVVALVFASPQLIAMAQQYASGGATVPPQALAINYTQFGVPLQTLFSPMPRVAYYGVHVPSGWAFNLTQGGASVQPAEGLPGFGLIASVLAGIGVLIGWRKRTRYTWWFLALWLGCAIFALGTSITIGSHCIANQTLPGEVYGPTCHQYIPLKGHIHWYHIDHNGLDEWAQVRVSNLMPYTWLVRIPWLSGLREADRFALVGMIGVALLAGVVVQWISQRRKWWVKIPVLVVVIALAIFEIGWQGGTTGPPFTPTETMLDRMSWLDAPIRADKSDSIVLDVPYGLRGGLRLVGSGISERALLLATEDGHPRAVSYTAWVPRPTVEAITAHPFYKYLLKYQNSTGKPTNYQLKAAAADLKTLNIGWVVEWRNLWRLNDPGLRIAKLAAYLRDLGFEEVRETCLVPTPTPRPVCAGHNEEVVWLLKYIPAWSYKNPSALERRLTPCEWFWQHYPGQKCTSARRAKPKHKS